MAPSRSTHKTYLKYVFILIAMALATVAGLNIVVDPFNKKNLVQLNLPKSDIAYKMHYPLFKSLEYRQSPASTLVLGDSRADALRKEFFVDVGSGDVYNMAYGGGTLDEIIDSFWYAQQQGQLKQVMIGLPFNLYRRNTSPNRFRQIESLRENVLPYYLSTLVTRASLLTIGSAYSGKALKSEVPDMTREQFWKSQLGRTTANFYGDWKAPEAAKAELQKISNFCKQNDIGLTFFIPPTHVELQAKIDEFELRDEYDEFVQFLSGLGVVLDFDFPNSITEDKALFKDPYHGTAEVNRNVVLALTSSEDRLRQMKFVKVY